MPRRIPFRYRVGLLVLLAAIALLTVTAVSLVLGKRSAEDLSGIETRYVPLIELDRDLKTTFAQIPHTLEDAAAAGEEGRVRDADALRDELLRRLRAGERTIADNGGDPAALSVELALYYGPARDISLALARGTPAGQLSPQVETMHRAQLAFTSHLDAATAPNREKLAAAFERARASQRASLQIDIAVAIGALLVMALLSWWIIRSTVRSVHAVKEGVERLAAGTFDREIVVESTDELGDLASEANRTASRLREYREQIEQQRHETQELLRTTEAANRELEAFGYSVSHDLRRPLRAIDAFSRALVEDCAAQLPPEGLDHLRRITAGAQRMAELIDDLLALSKVTRGEFRREHVELSAVAAAIAGELARNEPERRTEISIAPGVHAEADPKLMKIVLENLLGNAWKFTSKVPVAAIAFGVTDGVYFVRDNGAGFDMKYASTLFAPFQRLHTDKEFAGTGIGLATVSRIIQRHGGRIWAEAAVGTGATFRFTLPESRATG